MSEQTVKLFDESLEELVVISVLRSLETVKEHLLSSLKEEYIFVKEFNEVVKRLKFLIKEKGVIPSYTEIYHDLTLNDKVRLILQESKYNSDYIKEIVEAKGAIERLQDYSKQRKLYNSYEYIHNYFNNPNKKQDFSSVVTDLSNRIFEISSNTESTENSILRITDSTYTSLLEKNLREDRSGRYIPTGFKQFDRINRGLPRGGLSLVLSTTGGGKSLMCMYMMYHMASAGHKVCLVSLEMNEEELQDRRVCFLTGITLNEYKKQNFTEQQIQYIHSKVKEYQDHLVKVGGREDYKCRGNDITIEELLYSLKPFGYDVIIIDYLGLLKGVGGDDQWRKLSEAARFCKIFAEEHKMNVIACAQLSKEGEIRYSKGILEHANNSFSWIYGKKEMETKIIEVEQYKGRMSDRFNFYLKLDLPTMSVRDLDSNEADLHRNSMSSQSKTKQFSSTGKNFFGISN